MNDLWKYSLNDSTWTWVSGSNAINQTGIYGEKGVVGADNIPGSRKQAFGWYDAVNQEFWLFGGHGYGYYDTPPSKRSKRVGMSSKAVLTLFSFICTL